MTEKKLTAVEWLIKQIIEQSNDVKLFEKALAMERQQIIDAHYQGYRNFVDTTEISEQYFTDTYQSTK